MTDQDLVLAHNVYTNKGAYALFLGSGISRPAAIPTGWEIILKLITRLGILKTGSAPSDPVAWYQDQYQKTPNYSHIIEEMTNTSEERVNLLKPFFEASEDEISDGLKKPTLAHKAIAKLVQKGYIRVIVTTNFDRLIENALRELSIEASVISNPSHIENVMPLIHSSITIVKINGDYLDTKFLNLESELSAYDEKLADLLKFIFENFGLITSGWSAKWDIALRQVIEGANKFRFSTYFTYVHQYEQEMQELAGKRHGKLIKINNADSFFTELIENIDALEKGEISNPFTKQVALERLKKYISRDESSISLFELVKRIQDATFKQIFVNVLPNPSKESVKEAMQSQMKQIELVSNLIAEGVYWSKPLHHEIWLNVLAKFAHPPRNNSSWAIWSNLNYLPALSLLYVIGLSALLRKNYYLLNQMFLLQIINPYNNSEKTSIMTCVNTSEVIEKAQINEAMGTNKIVPVSELMYEFTKPFFLEFLPNKQLFDELFDEFELIVSLKFIELKGNAWFPRGRYSYRRRDSNNVVYTKFKQLQHERELLDWVLGHLFRHDTLLSAYNNFNTRMKEWSWD
jgi:hypothetical protein